MRKLLTALVLLLLISGTAFAIQPREVYLGNLTAIAWLEGETTLNVAIANESNARTMVSISTETWDTRWRPIFASRRITVPARSIVVETFRIERPRRGETIEVILSDLRRDVVVPVQESGIYQIDSYIVPANTQLDVGVDLKSAFSDSRVSRLVLDEFFYSTGAPSRGRIQVKSFEGGWKYIPSRNSVEYVEPEMILSMRTPQTNGLVALTFSITKVIDGYRVVEEEVPGPTIMVYGRNLRMARSSDYSDGSDTGWISK